MKRKIHVVVPDTEEVAQDQMVKYFRKMFEVYYLVDKLAIVELHDEIMSELVHLWDRAAELIRLDYFCNYTPEIYEKSVKGCTLRRFVIDTIAYLCTWRGSDGMSLEYKYHLRETPDFAADIVLALLTRTDKVDLDGMREIPKLSSSKKAAKHHVLHRKKKRAAP